jgi:hypothetical protein
MWVGVISLFFVIIRSAVSILVFSIGGNELLDAKAYEFVRIRIARGQCPKRVTAMRV